MEKFDLVILGGGPAGYNAAEKAGAAGLKTVVIEKRALGGVCLNEGCIPSKSLLYSAKIFDYTKHSEAYGVKIGNASVDQSFIIDRKNKVVKTLVSGIGMSMKKHGVKVVSADGKITGRNSEGFTVDAGGETYQGKYLLICTGSVPVVPPIPGLREHLASGLVMTNREILDLREIPKKLVVIGGGVIGLEMVSYFRTVGSEVTVIEMLDHIAGPTDSELGRILQKTLEAKGVKFELGCKVTGVEDGKVLYEKNGKTESAEADKVLCSIGRRAFTQDIGLETIAVETDRGAIVTDEYMKTNIAGVYAAGDVNGKVMLAHTAYREGEVAVNNILGKKDVMRYNAIPSVIYTNPEVGAVGETEDSAKAKGLDVEIVNLTLNYSGRYMAENEKGNGIVKLILGKKYHNVLGVQMIGSYASEIIYGGAIMVENEMTVEDLRQVVFPHPTVGEVIREALFEAKL